MVCRRLITQGKRHIATGSSVLESRGNADGENSRVVRVGTAGRVVIGQRHRGTADIAWAIFEGGCCAWEYGGEGGDGGKIENAACLDSGLMDGGDMGGRRCEFWVAEDMLRAKICCGGDGDREEEKHGKNHC